MGNRTCRSNETIGLQRFTSKISLSASSCVANAPKTRSVHARTSAVADPSSPGRESNTSASITACAPSGDFAVQYSVPSTDGLATWSSSFLGTVRPYAQWMTVKQTRRSKDASSAQTFEPKISFNPTSWNTSLQIISAVWPRTSPLGALGVHARVQTSLKSSLLAPLVGILQYKTSTGSQRWRPLLYNHCIRVNTNFWHMHMEHASRATRESYIGSYLERRPIGLRLVPR
jgi:hypothetical protein